MASARTVFLCLLARARSTTWMSPYNRSFDTDMQRHCAARRAGERTPRGAMPLRTGQLRREGSEMGESVLKASTRNLILLCLVAILGLIVGGCAPSQHGPSRRVNVEIRTD